MASQNTEPPFYVLISHSVLPTQRATGPQSPPALLHPVIQYHFADDDPRALLPRFPGEKVIVLDHIPDSSEGSSAQALSGSAVVTGIQVAETANVREHSTNRNEKMYIIDLISTENQPTDSNGDNSHDLLALFRERNATLHRSLNVSRGGPTSATLDATPKI